MAINYALDELLHWENENSSLNAIITEFRCSKLSKNLLQNAAKNQSAVYDEISDLLNKIVLISIYNGKRRFKSEDLSKEAFNLSNNCKENEFESTFNTINVIVPIYLENLKYPRMVHLFSKKSSREVLLAIAFIISKNNLFNIVDQKCNEVTNLTKQIAYNISLIADSSNSITLEDVYNEIGDENNFKSFLNSVFDKIDYNNFSATDCLTINNNNNNNESSDVTTKKSVKGSRFFKNRASKTVETDSTKRFNQAKVESLSCWIESALAFQKELTERGIMLATPKGCKDYDTERLRVGFEMIDTRMDARNDAILTRATASTDSIQQMRDEKGVNVSSEHNKSNQISKVESIASVDTECDVVGVDQKGVDKENVDQKNVDLNLVNSLSISSLSDQLIQLHHKLRLLSGSIYRKDSERSSMFSKAATQFKAHKSDLITDKLNKTQGDKSVHIKPSPLEYVLISDDNSFETNTALLAVIFRSLVSEFTRYKFWNLARKALVDANKSLTNIVPSKSGISVGIYKKPSDIKLDIQQLKSFLTKGISPGNFTNSCLSNSLPECHYDVILEFLRTINSQFTNITAQNTSKTILHRTLFHTFILEQLGHNDNVSKVANETVCDVKKRTFSSRFRHAVKNNPTIDLGIFNEWVIAGHLDDIPTVDDLTKLEQDNERDIFDQKVPFTPNDIKEAQEMEILDNKEFVENPLTNNISNTSKPCVYSMEFYSNLALSKNITAPDPSRASKGMGEFVSTIKSIHGRIVANLEKEQIESEAKLKNLADQLKRVTNCVILN